MTPSVLVFVLGVVLGSTGAIVAGLEVTPRNVVAVLMILAAGVCFAAA